MSLDPLPKYRFLVTLDPGDAYLPAAQALLLPLAASGAFQEVTGLGAQLEVTSYPEGGRNDSVHQLPLRHSWNRITLKRGVVRDPGLWSWYQAGLADSLGARRDGAVIVLGPDGALGAAWAFHGGLAAKWTGPDLHGEQNAIAIESLEIAHEGLTKVVQDAAASALPRQIQGR
ncbi:MULTISPECIES: phage tail protein [unclassified Streptomyces]|uniref:phage tail protein n=1 Tax=unclassified Streptomyces TaxID=2593676 RepID=UPI00168AC8CC|nr:MULTISPECIES: phage tail protein [unclassified Streptomyces]MBD3003910.1 phage tail protein [Streptomyces sp. 5-10]